MAQPVNPVKRLSAEKRSQRLLESFKKNDTVRQSERHPGEWLVSSSQFANVSYRVSYDTTNRRYSCGCEWFQRTGLACRHMTRVSWELAQLKKAAKPVLAAVGD